MSDLHSFLDEINRLNENVSSLDEHTSLSSPDIDLLSSSSIRNISEDSMLNETFLQRASQISGKKLNSFQDILNELENLQTLMLKKNLKQTENQILSKFNHILSTDFDKFDTFFDYVKSIKEENNQLKIELQKNSRYSQSQAELDLHEANLKISNLKDQVERITQTKKTLETAFDQIHNLVKNQQEEINTLVAERNSLVGIVHKSAQITEKSQQIYQFPILNNNKTFPKTNLPSSNTFENSFDDKMYPLLATISRNIKNSIPTIDIDTIRNNSSFSLSDRLIQIVQNLLDHIKESAEEKSKFEEQIKSSDEKFDRLFKHYKQLNKVFEEEICFLNYLTNSKDLQDIVFYREDLAKSLQLNNLRTHLINRCTHLASLADESKEAIHLISDIPELEQRKLIFSFLSNESDCSRKIQEIINNYDETSENSEIFDLLFAQIVMNQILEHHIQCLQTTLTSHHELNRQVEILNSRIHEIEDENSRLLDQISNNKKHERILRKELNINRHANLFESILTLIHDFSEVNSKIPSHEKMISIKQCIKKQKKEIQSLDNKLSAALNEIKEKDDNIQELQDQSKALNEINKQYKKQIDDFSQEKEILFHTINEAKNSQNMIIKDKEEEISKLKSQLKLMKSAADKVPQLENELQSCNQDQISLKKKIKDLERMNLSSIQSLKEKAQALRSQYETTSLALNKYQSSNLTLNQKINDLTQSLADSNAKVEQSNIIRQTLEMKLKNLEEKSNNDLKSLESKYHASLRSFPSQSAMNKLQNKIQQIQLLLKPIIDNPQSKDIDVFDQVQNLVEQFKQLKSKQSIYSTVMEDFSKSQGLLSLEKGKLLAPTISELLTQNERLLKDSQIAKEQSETIENRMKKLEKDNTKLHEMAIGMKQWETWATRLIKIIQQRNICDWSSEQLRLTLEEALLSSKSIETIYRKMLSLREEKKALLKFGNSFIHSSPSPHPTWNSLLAIIIFCNRAIKRAGCTPISSH